MAKHATPTPAHEKKIPATTHPREYAEDPANAGRFKYSVYQYDAHRTDLKYTRIADTHTLDVAKMIHKFSSNNDDHTDRVQIWDNTQGVRIDLHPALGLRTGKTSE